MKHQILPKLWSVEYHQWFKVNIFQSMSHLWILRTSNFCLLHLKMPVTKKIDLQRRTISTLLGSYTPVSVPYTLFTLINQTSCCSSLLLLKPISTPAINFQYLYTCKAFISPVWQGFSARRPIWIVQLLKCCVKT